MRDTTRETGTFFYVILDMNVPVLAGQQELIYLCSRCSLENLLGAMDERDGWRERVREIRVDNDDCDDGGGILIYFDDKCKPDQLGQ